MYSTSIISPAKPRISPDSCVLLATHCIPRDVNMISPHFWSCESIPSRSEHSVLTPHPTRLFTSRFTTHLNPTLRSTMVGNEIRSPTIQVKCLVSDPNFRVRITKILFLASCSVLLAFHWIAVELRSDTRNH